jgi:hypothetical protein
MITSRTHTGSPDVLSLPQRDEDAYARPYARDSRVDAG